MELHSWAMMQNYVEEEEDIELYKEKLKEMETAFRYNLKLLADRDAELDLVEQQLRNGIFQMEKVSQEKAECEEILRLLEEQKTKEARRMKRILIDQENTIKNLERRNDDNLRTLKKALENVNLEKREERQRAEKNLIRTIKIKEKQHSEELKRMESAHAEHLEEAARGRQRLIYENRNLRKLLAGAEKREKTQHLNGNREQIRRIARDKGTMTEFTLAEGGTQTAVPHDHEVLMLREQNEVLKRIVKNLKKKMVPREREEDRESGEYEMVLEKIEETNRRFEAEIKQVKNEVERERTEEEAIIHSLEKNLTSLKHKLLENLAGGDNVMLLEEKLNKRLEKIDEKLDELRKRIGHNNSKNLTNTLH